MAVRSLFILFTTSFFISFLIKSFLNVELAVLDDDDDLLVMDWAGDLGGVNSQL
jgi:hypothetical protein